MMSLRRSVNAPRSAFPFLMVCLVSVVAGCAGCSKSDDPVRTTELVALNGEYYRGEMGSAALDPELRFAVRDDRGGFASGEIMRLSLLEGDGNLAADSIMAGSDGVAVATYTFSGALGHALIRVVGRKGADTLEVVLRASALIPGERGQGQYILFDDLYRDVLALNGPPASLDEYPDHPFHYANYEDAVGVVIILDAADTIDVTNATQVHGVILNTKFDRKTAEGIGVGSTITELRSAYGEPWPPYVDQGDINVSFPELGMTFYCAAGDPDTTVLEIHVFPPPAP